MSLICNNKELEKTIKLQREASNPRVSAWVFASAGSGKTKVLTDRVLRLLLDGARPNKILCLTFTKTAAAEMQERINARLASWVILDEKELINEIANLTGATVSENDLKKARILFAKILDADSQIKVQTIHAFCQNLVKIFPFEIGVRPNFEVMDGNMEKLLLQKAKKAVFLDSAHDELLRNSINKINARLSEDSFDELVTKILSQKENLLFLKEKFLGIDNIISEIYKNFDVNSSENEGDIFNNFIAKIDCNKIINIANDLQSSQLKTNQKTAFAIKNFLQNKKIENFTIYKNAFFTKEQVARKLGSVVTKEYSHYFSAIEEQQILIADFLDKLNSCKIVEATSLLLLFIDKILSKYAELKNAESFLDYNDLIIRTDKMLQSPDSSDWVKFRMDGFFDHILIDESQDTNNRQWSIIKALSEDFFSGYGAQSQNRTIFIIGDDKQSIYSFQGSEPNISQEIFDYYQKKLDGGSYKIHKIDLQNSFRSLEKILNAVNKVFANSNYMGSLEYQEHSAIRQGEGRVEIWPQIKNRKDEIAENFDWKINYSQDEKYAQKELMAEIIALKIKGWVQSKRELEGKNCAINYGDIMILLRNRANGFDKILQKFLQQNSIPFGGAKKTNFADELLIQDLLSAAKFALLQDDDLNLACLLKSPIIGFSEDDLFKVSIIKNEKEISLYNALKLEESGFEAIYKTLENLIENSRQYNCFDFFSNLLTQELRKKIAAEFGQEGLYLLDQFMIILANFYQNNSANLQKFLDFVEKLNPEISLNAVGKNQVMITTIHSSKGLQAPIVIIPDCCFNFNQTLSAKENFFWMNFDDHKLPIWCPKKSDENFLVESYKKQKIKEIKEESFRLFYVAMTRAENELYFGGFGNSSSEESWYEIAKKSLENEAQKLDFIDLFSDDEKKILEKKIEKFIIDDKVMRLYQN